MKAGIRPITNLIDPTVFNLIPQAGRGLQPRPEHFDTAAICVPYEKLCELGSVPYPAYCISYELAACFRTSTAH